MSSPASLTDVAKHTVACINELLDAELERWGAIDEQLEFPIEQLRTMVHAGGKRIRPAFCTWAFAGTGGNPFDPHVVRACAGLELLHTFALIHDDVMDNASSRRSTQTIHEYSAERHRDAGWRGESRRFGDGIAILVGDLAFTYADQLFEGAPLIAREVFRELRVEVTFGQYLDVENSAHSVPTVERSRRIAQYKSGKYTIERPLHIGAAMNEQLVPWSKLLSDYGMPLGEAFQLRDDLLDVFSTTKSIGKPVGQDIRDAKPTVLMAIAFEQSKSIDRQMLEQLFGKNELSESDVDIVRDICERSGAKAQVESLINELCASAVSTMPKMREQGFAAEAADELDALAEFVSHRSA